MGLSLNKVKKIQEKYIQQYVTYPPINGVGISNLRVQKEVCRKTFDLRAGESIDDLCLNVYFETVPPKEMTFPLEYMGIRVFYNVIGKIRAL